jgi:hypothetical protein
VLGTGLTYSTISVSQSGNLNKFGFNGNSTVGTLTLNPPLSIEVSTSMTISNALTISGTAFNNAVSILGQPNNTNTWTLTGGGTFHWTSIGNMTFTGSPSADNSFNIGGNTGITITGPSGGCGGHIIGG